MDPEIRQQDFDAAMRVFRLMCALAGGIPPDAGRLRGKYDPDDFDADELGLDPEDDYDA